MISLNVPNSLSCLSVGQVAATVIIDNSILRAQTAQCQPRLLLHLSVVQCTLISVTQPLRRPYTDMSRSDLTENRALGVRFQSATIDEIIDSLDISVESDRIRSWYVSVHFMLVTVVN